MRFFFQLGCLVVFCLALFHGTRLHAEINDPFGDPGEPSPSPSVDNDEDEGPPAPIIRRKHFLGVYGGIGMFTGGLGSTTKPAGTAGVKFVYLWRPNIGIELSAQYSYHLDVVEPSAGQSVNIQTTLIPIVAGLRYYFGGLKPGKFARVANPYLAGGAGLYHRYQDIVNATGGLEIHSGSAVTSSFGAYVGGGLEFGLFHKRLYIGTDLRYNFIFFSPDLTGLSLPSGSRSGGYFAAVVPLTFNF